MIIKQDFLPRGCKARSGILMKDITSITIHWTGPFPGQSPSGVRTWWWKGSDGTGVEASAHYIIKGEEVLQCIPGSEVAWHAGCPEGNYHSIGIELIAMNKEGQFSDTTIEQCGVLLKQLPQVQLKRHFDWTGKLCPVYYVDNQRWEDLKRAFSDV